MDDLQAQIAAFYETLPQRSARCARRRSADAKYGENMQHASATAVPSRVAIFGAGNVGATLAYTLQLSGLAAEIVLVDVAAERAVGEAMDLSHAVPFSQPTRIWARL
jgi:L-lactate dehydrogenase